MKKGHVIRGVAYCRGRTQSKPLWEKVRSVFHGDVEFRFGGQVEVGVIGRPGALMCPASEWAYVQLEMPWVQLCVSLDDGPNDPLGDIVHRLQGTISPRALHSTFLGRGPEWTEAVRANPYTLCGGTIALEDIDRAFRGHDYDRTVGVVLAAVARAENQGHTFCHTWWRQ